MKLEIHFKEIESSDGIRQHILERSEKLKTFLAPDEHVNVTVGAKFKGQQHHAEIYWHDNLIGKDFRASSEGHDLYTQIDEIFEKVLKQVVQMNSKLIDEKRRRPAAKKAHLE